ncbi:hypothetical protein ACFSZS_21730 [Seohaeicola zhoushanensis]
MLDRGLALFGIGLVFGGGFGFLTAAGMGVTLDGHDHATGHGHAEAPAHDHAHADPVEIAPGGTVPGVTLAALPDSAGGWNVHVAVSDFTFSPKTRGRAMSRARGMCTSTSTARRSPGSMAHGCISAQGNPGRC